MDGKQATLSLHITPCPHRSITNGRHRHTYIRKEPESQSEGLRALLVGEKCRPPHGRGPSWFRAYVLREAEEALAALCRVAV